jgi:hypothetical protein
MGTEFASALEKLAQLLTAKNKAAPSANGALVVSQANQVLKIELFK